MKILQRVVCHVAWTLKVYSKRIDQAISAVDFQEIKKIQ